jgi:hypothetical protein
LTRLASAVADGVAISSEGNVGKRGALGPKPATLTGKPHAPVRTGSNTGGGEVRRLSVRIRPRGKRLHFERAPGRYLQKVIGTRLRDIQIIVRPERDAFRIREFA